MGKFFKTDKEYIDHKRFLCVKTIKMTYGDIAFIKDEVYDIVKYDNGSYLHIYMNSEVSDSHGVDIDFIDDYFVPYYEEDIGDMEEWEDETNEEYNYNKNKFEVGDPVCLGFDKDSCGIILNINKDYDEIKVLWKSYTEDLIYTNYYTSFDLELCELEDIGDMEEWGDEINEKLSEDSAELQEGDIIEIVDTIGRDKYNILGKRGIVKIVNKNWYGIEFYDIIPNYTGMRVPGCKEGCGVWIHRENDYIVIKNLSIGDMEEWEDETNEEYDYKKNEFEVGDRVVFKKHEHLGEGTIKKINLSGAFSIEFDKNVNRHDCAGICKKGHGYYLSKVNLELVEPEDIGDMEEWEDVQERYNYNHYPIVIGVGYNNDINIHNKLGYIIEERALTYGIDFIDRFTNRQRKINDKYNSDNGLWIKKENVIIVDTDYYNRFINNQHRIKITKKIKDILPLGNIMMDDDINEIDYSNDRDDVVLVNGREFRLGRLYNRIFDFLTDQEIEKLVNYYKYKYNNNIKKEIKLKIVEGEDIRYWYNCENYGEGNGTLNNSCIRYPHYANRLDLFVDNPNKIKMSILLDSKKKLIGRTLIWALDSPQYRMYMDRIYTTEDKYKDYFVNHANKHNMIMYDSLEFFNNDDNIIEVYGNPKIMEIRDIRNYKKNHPSMDTFKCYYPEEGVLRNYIIKNENIDFYIEI